MRVLRGIGSWAWPRGESQLTRCKELGYNGSIADELSRSLVYVEGDAEMQRYEDKEGISRTALNIVQRMYSPSPYHYTLMLLWSRNFPLTRSIDTQATWKSSNDKTLGKANKQFTSQIPLQPNFHIRELRISDAEKRHGFQFTRLLKSIPCLVVDLLFFSSNFGVGECLYE